MDFKTKTEFYGKKINNKNEWLKTITKLVY